MMNWSALSPGMGCSEECGHLSVFGWGEDARLSLQEMLCQILVSRRALAIL